jgi:hypothetical protein
MKLSKIFIDAKLSPLKPPNENIYRKKLAAKMSCGK